MRMAVIQYDSRDQQEYMVLNVSGVCYCLSKTTAGFLPEGLMMRLWHYLHGERIHLPRGVFHMQHSNQFFVQRSPQLFDVVLQCYVTGRIHVPPWMCRQSILDEIRFWHVDSELACFCCSEEQDEEVEEETVEVKQSTTLRRRSKWIKTKKRMWRFFHEPKSSRGAFVRDQLASEFFPYIVWHHFQDCSFRGALWTNKMLNLSEVVPYENLSIEQTDVVPIGIFACTTMTFVAVSILNLVIGSVPSLHLCPTNATEVYSSDDGAKIKESLQTPLSEFNNTLEATNITISFKPEGILRFFSNCLGMQKFEMVDMICIAWFTVELILRIVACPNALKFVKSPLNLIDFLASFPLYVELLLWIFEIDSKHINYNIMLLFRVLRSVTVLRILKLARYSQDLRILGKTIQSAKSELSMLWLFVAVTVLVFSSVVFQLEHDDPGTKYTSIPTSMWWAIATLTTVGYGDIYPKTVAGKMVGSFACIAGIMIVALPVSVLVEHFTAAYKKKSQAAFSRQRLGTKLVH